MKIWWHASLNIQISGKHNNFKQNLVTCCWRKKKEKEKRGLYSCSTDMGNQNYPIWVVNAGNNPITLVFLKFSIVTEFWEMHKETGQVLILNKLNVRTVSSYIDQLSPKLLSLLCRYCPGKYIRVRLFNFHFLDCPKWCTCQEKLTIYQNLTNKKTFVLIRHPETRASKLNSRHWTQHNKYNHYNLVGIQEKVFLKYTGNRAGLYWGWVTCRLWRGRTPLGRNEEEIFPPPQDPPGRVTSWETSAEVFLTKASWHHGRGTRVRRPLQRALTPRHYSKSFPLMLAHLRISH